MSSADGTSTGAQLATAASCLHTILCFGQADLTGRDSDLIAAVQARDQIVAALGVTWRATVPGQDLAEPGDPSPVWTARRELHHSVAAAGLVLRRYPLTGLPGPAPTDLQLHPPVAPSARAWVQAAQINDRVAAHTSRGQRVGPVAVDAFTGRWAMIADLAAVAGAVAVLDPALADHARASSLPELHRAGAVLHDARHHAEDLAAAADVVIRLARSGALPQDYEVHVPGPGSITTLGEVPAALDWTRTVLADGPALTATQYRLLAGAIAVVAYHLGRVVEDAPSGSALAHLAEVHHRFAESWHRWPLAATGAGDVRALTHVRHVASLLITSAEDALTADLAAVLAPRVVVLARTVQESLFTAIADGAFLTPADTSRGWTPLSGIRGLHRRVLGALTTLVAATDAAALAVGPVRPVTPTDPAPYLGAATRLAPYLELVRPPNPVTTPTRTGRSRPPPPIPGPAPGTVSRRPSR
ncbi:MAG: hypothetical protein WAL50_12480 [Kineosporiaceae bacterium]